ncbi:hypothetical protein JCM37172_20500 [Faecalimonas hominis]
MRTSEVQDGKRHQGCPAFYQKPEECGILPVNTRGFATITASLRRNVWWYFWGVFGGIGGIAE